MNRAGAILLTTLLAAPALREAAAQHAGQHADGHAPAAPRAADEPAQHHAHESPDGDRAGATQGPSMPPLTDADRAAAFPAELGGHPAHDHVIRGFALAEKFEWRDGHAGGAPVWDVSGWLGGDIDRLWFRSDGHVVGGAVDEADLELLWGHAVSPWWDVVLGVRQDFAPGTARTWAAFGVQGLAPQWFEVQLTGYVGEYGQVAVQLQTDYDLLLTNRLILQPRVDVTAYTQDETSREIGSGVSNVAFGARLRYEFRREFAPYLGFEWARALGDTGDFARAAGRQVEDTRLVAGIRFWF